MPIYEYRCECGALLETLDRIGVTRERCGELCISPPPSAGAQAAPPESGRGLLTRVYSAPGIRGDGREAKEAVFDPVKRSNRPGCDCEDG